jgi:hypothetical protein
MRQKAGAQGGQKADSRRAAGLDNEQRNREHCWTWEPLFQSLSNLVEPGFGTRRRPLRSARRRRRSTRHLVADAAGTKDHPLRRLKCERAGRLARRELRKSACEFSVVIELEHRSKTDRGVGFAPGCLEGVNPGGIAAQHCDALCVRVDHRRGNAKALSAAERDGGAHRCACWRIPTA